MVLHQGKEEKIKIDLKTKPYVVIITRSRHAYEIQRSTLASKEDFLGMLLDSTSLKTDSVCFYQVCVLPVT